MSIECFVLRSARLYRAAGQCTVTDEFRIELFYQIDDRPEPGQGTGEPETVLLQVCVCSLIDLWSMALFQRQLCFIYLFTHNF